MHVCSQPPTFSPCSVPFALRRHRQFLRDALLPFLPPPIPLSSSQPVTTCFTLDPIPFTAPNTFLLACGQVTTLCVYNFYYGKLQTNHGQSYFLYTSTCQPYIIFESNIMHHMLSVNISQYVHIAFLYNDSQWQMKTH